MPNMVDVRVTPTEQLLTANVRHSYGEEDGEVVLCEFVNGPLFRSCRASTKPLTQEILFGDRKEAWAAEGGVYASPRKLCR